MAIPSKRFSSRVISVFFYGSFLIEQKHAYIQKEKGDDEKKNTHTHRTRIILAIEWKRIKKVSEQANERKKVGNKSPKNTTIRMC